MKYFLLIFLTTIINIVSADEEIVITEPAQVSALHAVHEKLDAVSDAVMQCIETGEEHATCLCTHKELIIKFNSSVDGLFVNYPEFKNHDLVRFKATDGMWITQSLRGIRKQASDEPSCN